MGTSYAARERDAKIANVSSRCLPLSYAAPPRRHGAHFRRDVRRRTAGSTDVSHLITRFEREAPRDYFDGRVRALTAGAPFTDAEVATAVAFESWASDLDDAGPAWTRCFLFAKSGYIVADRDQHGD